MSTQQKVYRKKGESVPEEETKGEKTETTQQEGNNRGGRGRGRGRGDRGTDRGGRGVGRGGPRPNAQHDDRENKGVRYQKKGEEGEESKEGNNQRRGGPREKKDLDENSAYYKYFYGERLRYQREPVTLETVIEENIARDQRKKQPNKEQFNKEMAAFDKVIESHRQEIRKVGGSKKDIIEGGKVGGTQMTYKDYLKTKIDAVKEVKDRKRKINEQLNEFNSKLETFEEQKKELKRFMLKEYPTPESIVKGITDLKKRYETTTLSKQDENRVLKDLE